MADEIKEIWANMHRWTFVLCLALSIGLIVASWFVPPMAVVDGTVLAAVGELFGFAALATVIQAVDKGHKATITKGDTTLTVGKDADEGKNKELLEEYDN